MVKASIAKKELITDETRGNIQYNVFHVQVRPKADKAGPISCASHQVSKTD